MDYLFLNERNIFSNIILILFVTSLAYGDVGSINDGDTKFYC